MTSELTTMQAVEGLLNEVFDISTTNERKRNIENLLSNFGQQVGAWKLCLAFLEKSKSYYVHMYALSLLENAINSGWYGITSAEKEEIRTFLFHYVLSKYKQIPSYVRNKILKAIADIARNDWPHQYPEYFNLLFQLLNDSSTVGLGVLAIQITSEEFVSPREDINISRRNEIKELLANQTGTILQILQEILNGILLKHRKLVNADTPPPSPNGGGSPYHTPTALVQTTHNSPYASPRHSPHRNASPNPVSTSSGQDSILNLSTSSFSGRVDSRQPMDLSSEELVISIMSCLTHLFSWMPLSNMITTSLVTKLFSFAEYGALNALNSCEENKAAEVGIQAMGAINEIMSKNFVPAEFESFLLKVFQQTLGLLFQITKNCSHSSGEGLLSKLNESIA